MVRKHCISLVISNHVLEYAYARNKAWPVSKNVRQQWLPEHMEIAIKAVCKKQKTLREAARCSNILKSTQASKVKKSLSGSDPLNLVNEVLGRKPIFPAALEKKLVEYFTMMDTRYYFLREKMFIRWLLP